MSGIVWKNGPLTGRRIRITKVVPLVSRQWVEEDGERRVCQVALDVGRTGTIGTLATLDQVNHALYPPVNLHSLKSVYDEEFRTGAEYLVIWDPPRGDTDGPIIDSYYEGEILAYTKFALGGAL